MNLMKDNIIPGDHGKVFGTNAKEMHDLELIKSQLLKLEGVKDIHINFDIFPREFTVHTSKLMNITDIEKMVIKTGFHAIPKTLFKL